jgi:hypothetical protein
MFTGGPSGRPRSLRSVRAAGVVELQRHIAEMSRKVLDLEGKEICNIPWAMLTSPMVKTAEKSVRAGRDSR